MFSLFFSSFYTENSVTFINACKHNRRVRCGAMEIAIERVEEGEAEITILDIFPQTVLQLLNR